MRLRVSRACELLAQTDQPITDIALAAGFYDHTDFARHFKKHTGQSASEYRRAASASR
ncbi:MAG: helix-turn-helix domain-containing protein [Planctomycetota bacterium]